MKWRSQLWSVVLLGFVAVTLLTAPASGCEPPDYTASATDHYQDQNGEWHVLQSSDPWSRPAEYMYAVVIRVYDESWNEQRTVEINRLGEFDDRYFEAFAPASGGGWWLESDDGTYYQASADGNFTGNSTDTAPQSFDEVHQDLRDEVDVDNEIRSGSVINVEQGEDGFLWALTDRGDVYQYTDYGQFTSESHDVASYRDAGCNYWPSILTGSIGKGALLVVGTILVFLRREYFASSLAFFVTSVTIASGFDAYWLAEPFSVVYLTPDAVLVAAIAAYVGGQVAFVYETGRDTTIERDLAYFVGINLPLLLVALALLG